MARYNTRDYPIKELYYYIIDFRRIMFPSVMPVCFPNKHAAARVLKHNVPNRNVRKFYSIYSGKKIKKMELNYIVGQGNYLFLGGKYPYPYPDMTAQEKKSYRTLMRRRLRRMGMQTTNKTKFKFYEKAKKVKFKPNTQKVARNKNSDAKVFQIDRKPRYLYYIILEKQLTSKRGKLFKVRAIQVNIKNGNHKVVTIYTNRNDIFFPELLNNLNKIENAKPAVTAYLRYCQGKQDAAVQELI